MSDRLHDTLSALRTDVDHMPLADSSAVRARGTQRTRRQAVGTSLAVVALVAGVIGVSGALTGANDRAENLPAEPTIEQPLALADEPFLAPSDLTGFGGYDEIGPFVDAGAEPTVDPQECRVRPAGWGAVEVRSTRFYHRDGSEVSIYEYVLRFADSDAAAAAISRVGTDLAACATVDPKDGELTVRGPEAVDAALPAQRASRAFVPAVASETHYGETAAAQDRNVVVVLDWSAYGNPGEESTGWAWDAQRLTTALERAVR